MAQTSLTVPVSVVIDPNYLQEGDQLIHRETFDVVTLKRRGRSGGMWWLHGGGIIRDAAISPTKEQRPDGPLWLLIKGQP